MIDLPPQNIEAEEGVIGSMVLDNRTIDDVMLECIESDLYRDALQIMFAAIRDLHDQGRPVDPVTLKDELERRDQFKQAGGVDYLAHVVSSVPHAANAKYYAQIVRQKSVARRLIEVATETVREGYSNNFTAEELLESAERRVFAIASEQVQGSTFTLGAVMTEVHDRLTKRVANGGHSAGLATGLIDLDDVLGGLESEALVVIAARPSMGKTALALNIADHVALSGGEPVLLISLEMSRHAIGERWLASRSRIDGHKLRTGHNLSTRDMHDVGRVYQEFVAAPVHIDDTPARSMLEIASNARRIKAREGLALVIVDYIQLVDPDDPRDSRQEQVAKISRRLKTLARDLEVPVIAMSQLNRAVESREDRRPRMSDLRESGAIEQDADVVILLHRPEYYDANDQPGIAELIVAKNRNGATGTVRTVFLRHLQRFESEAPHVVGLPPGETPAF